MVEVDLSATLRQRLAGGGPVVALTGAGISAESGLATFRGPGGLWEGRRPEELATPEAFRRDPEQVWRFYAWRRAQAAAAQPNAAHRALADLEDVVETFTLVTQNVDGLHERAGQREVLRLHGSLWRLHCVGGCATVDDHRVEFVDGPPRCGCGALLRPGVVWFGEPLPADVVSRAERAMRSAALVLVVGTSARVHPAAALPGIARSRGAWIVEVNPEPTALSDEVDERLRGAAGEILPAIARAAGAPR